MKIAFNPSTVVALTTPPNNKDITFDLRGRNIFARGVKFCGTDTNTWRDIKINNVSIGSNILDLRNGSNTTLTNTNGVVTINSTWRPVVDNLTSDSTTSSLSANQGRVLAGLISTLSTNISNQYALRDGSNATGRWRGGLACFDVRDTNYAPSDLNMGLELLFLRNNTNNLKDGGEYNGVFSFRQWASGSDWSGGKAHQLSFTDNGNIWHRTSSGDDSWGAWKKLAYSTDIPSSLKNPYALTISLNGTSQGPYDGSAAKNINITPSSIGAATSDHNHDGRYVRYYAVTTLDCNNLAPGLTTVENTATNSAVVNHSAFLYISDVGTPFQIQIPDSNTSYIFKRSYSSGKWSGWFKLNAGYADSAGSATKLETARNIFGLPFDGTNDIGSRSFLIDSNIDTDTSAIKWTAKIVSKYTSASTGGQGLLIGAATDRKYCRGGGIAAYATNVQGNNTNLAIYKSQGSDYDVKPVEVITITDNFNVGIGTTSPSSKLTVNGDISLFNIGSIRNLAIGGGMYWNPYVESASDGTDAASITLVRQGVAGGTTLVLSQMNDANDTIQFQTNGSARLYHNSYPILTTQNTYVSNNKGYINGTEITQVNNTNLLDGLDWNNFFSRRFYTFNLSSYSLSNFYPLFFVDTDIELDCEIHSNGGGWQDPYNQNRLHFQITSRGWADTGLSFHLLSQDTYDNNEITIGSIGIGTHQGGICIWVRGGRTYRVYSNREPLFKSSNYTYGDEIYSVGTNIWGGTNTNVNLVWKNDSTRKDALIATLTDNVASATKVIVNQHTANDTNYPLVWSNQNNSNTVTENQLYKSWSDLYYNPKNKRLTVGGSIYAAHFYESSDKALKKNIKSILSSTNIPKIREFDWKDTGEHSYGFIAQELEEQGYGCLVSETNGKKTVNYTATLALTVAKLQNLINIQNKKISNLTKELKALKYGRKKNS